MGFYKGGQQSFGQVMRVVLLSSGHRSSVLHARVIDNEKCVGEVGLMIKLRGRYCIISKVTRFMVYGKNEV